MAGKLHELLAVEKNLEDAAKAVTEESLRTFTRSSHLFQGSEKKYEPFNEADANLANVEAIKLESTVDENLEYTNEVLARHWDAVLQKDVANQQARADIVVNGEVIATEVPATFLLGLESKLKKLRQVMLAIPTLETGVDWIEDKTNEKAGVFKTINPVKTIRTENVIDWQIVAEATPQHKAQVKEVRTTNNIGAYLTTKQSGMLTPADKAARITRLDDLIQGVKIARARANCVEVEDNSVGMKLINFVNG